MLQRVIESYIYPPTQVYIKQPNFFETTTLDERQKIFKRFCNKYPDKHPVIVLLDDPTGNTPALPNEKFGALKDMTFGNFCAHVRSRLELPSSQALFYFVGKYKRCAAHNQLISQVVQEYANEDDGFLVLYYHSETTFG
jgi:hypothetical protein